MNNLVSEMRRDYTAHGLSLADVAADPIAQFSAWFDAAVAANLYEPNAMTLATSTPDGQPSARMVLLKGFDARGFVFFSNYASRKGAELAANGRAALVFWWGDLHRQIRIEGGVVRVADEESDAYFQSRPFGSQLGAWASPQSQIISGREVLEQTLADLEVRYGNAAAVPRPPHWGGYRVVPAAIEFWQGRPNRLHDRIKYTRTAETEWRIERLAP